MDYVDLTAKIKRIYLSIGERIDLDVLKNVKVDTEHTKEGKTRIHLHFSSDIDEEDNKIILDIIHNLAKLKDNLKDKFKERSIDPEIIERVVNGSDSLQIIIDIDNQEKHSCYPLTKYKRSFKDPRIINIKRGLGIAPDNNEATFFLSHSGGKFISENCAIYINADIVDGDNNFLSSLDDLIIKGLKDWSDTINKYLI